MDLIYPAVLDNMQQIARRGKETDWLRLPPATSRLSSRLMPGLLAVKWAPCHLGWEVTSSMDMNASTSLPCVLLAREAGMAYQAGLTGLPGSGRPQLTQ